MTQTSSPLQLRAAKLSPGVCPRWHDFVGASESLNRESESLTAKTTRPLPPKTPSSAEQPRKLAELVAFMRMVSSMWAPPPLPPPPPPLWPGTARCGPEHPSRRESARPGRLCPRVPCWHGKRNPSSMMLCLPSENSDSPGCTAESLNVAVQLSKSALLCSRRKLLASRPPPSPASKKENSTKLRATGWMPRETSALRSLPCALRTPEQAPLYEPWRISRCPHATPMATVHDVPLNSAQASALQLHATGAQHSHTTLQRGPAHVVSVC